MLSNLHQYVLSPCNIEYLHLLLKIAKIDIDINEGMMLVGKSDRERAITSLL